MEQIKEIEEKKDELERNLVEFATSIEEACFELKTRIAARHGITDEEPSAVSEANFNLNYTECTSQKLGTFEVAEQKANLQEKWTRAFNILKKNNSTISNRYHGKGYAYSYWLYGKNNERIYRQKLKQKNEEKNT